MSREIRVMLSLVAFALVMCIVAAGAGLWARGHVPARHDYTTDYRYTFKFEDGTTFWSDMPPDFGYLDTMTCVYVGVNQKGAHFSRVCRPADQTILVTDKYAQEVKDPMK